jgi:hypothetical protein
MDMLGYAADPWQRTLLRTAAQRVALCCSRQLGKSTSTACVALNEACLNDDALVLLVSPSERQSGELHEKVVRFHKGLRRVESVRELALSLELANGSKVVGLPGSADTIRGYSAPRLVIVDEASRVTDDLLAAVLPMLVTNHGRLFILSTPRGRIGFFYEVFTSDDPQWLRINAKASESPRISQERLAEMRRTLGERAYAAEFENVFTDEVDQVFSEANIEGMFSDDALGRGYDAVDLEEV